MTERAIHFGVLLSALALAGWVFASHTHDAPTASIAATKRAGAAPFAIIPPGAAFLLSADLTRFAQSPLAALLAPRLARLPGANDLAEVCGFDPLTRLSQLALAVPSAGSAAQQHAGDFGIVAEGRFSGAEIARCASAVIAKRGGKPTSSSIGSFASVRDRDGSGGEVAARDGLLIVSGGGYFRGLLDSAEAGTNERQREDTRDARHAQLRSALGSGDIVATWLLPDGWLERVTGEDNARLSPLRALKALGARVVLGNQARLLILLQCADPEGAAKVSELLTQLRATFGSLAVSPALSAAARRIQMSPEGNRLTLTLTLEQAELLPLLDMLLGP